MGDGVSIQTKRALIESGAYTPEDLGLVSAPKPSNEATWAVGGSSAAADQRKITGETPLQQRQRQDAQLRALLEARKRKGYAGGGIVQGALARLAKAKLGPQRGLSVVRDFALGIPGPAVRGKSFEHEDFGELVDLLAPFGRAKALPPDHASIFSEMINNANHPDYPDAVTRVTLDSNGRPQAAYQVLPAADTSIDPDYLAYLVGLGDRGAGTQAVEHAKRMSPGKMRTYPAPSAQQFWNKVAERQPGWRVEPGGAVDVDSLLWEESKGYAGGGAVLGGLGRLAKHLSGDAPVRRGVADVIKERGGQWLSGAYSPEAALKPLRQMPFGKEPEDRLLQLDQFEKNMSDPLSLAALARDRIRLQNEVALNSFVDKQLTKYVKRDLATEGDPVRKLAEQGILHVKPESIYDADVADFANTSRRAARRNGFAKAGARGESDMAATWDAAADASLYTGKAKLINEDARHLVEQDPWLAKVDPSTPVYEPASAPVDGYNLGFEHLMDELGNALNPESGLPAHLRITPEQIKSGNFSMEAAVRHVAKINDWRRDQKLALSQTLANNPATHLFKDYPDKGYKWVELKVPESRDTTKGHPLSGEDAYAQLKEALKYEGDTMGHCVGGYCDDVASGRSRIYSLRDAKGQPHVTIEAQPYAGNVPITDEIRADRSYLGPFDKFINFETGEGSEHHIPPGLSIVQIKGKGNQKPAANYIPFVQDFVKSGQWSEVGDLRNADLIPRRQLLLSGDEEGKVVGDYFTKEEYDALNKSRGYASGGLIGLNPRKPLELTVTPDDVLYGSEVDEKNATAADQAYDESRRRMFAARQREDSSAQRMAVIDRILSELPSSTYTPPTEFSESKVAPAFSSFDEAVEAGGDLRLGLGQLIASPLMVTDIVEAGLDKLRGVQSPNRFRQVSNAVSKVLGGPEEPDMRLEGPHDMQFLAASLANPVNFLPAGKAKTILKKLPRFAEGGEIDLYALHGYN